MDMTDPGGIASGESFAFAAQATKESGPDARAARSRHAGAFGNLLCAKPLTEQVLEVTSVNVV